MKYKIIESHFGIYDSVILLNQDTGEKAEIALTGATLLSYHVPLNNRLFNIIDGFENSDEFKASKGARCWIMIPFANRIPGGRYTFGGKDYILAPMPPRTNVIHGFASNLIYRLISAAGNDSSVEIKLALQDIRPGLVEGYPFSLDIFITFSLTDRRLAINISAKNVGTLSAPFGTGWHPYFKTNDKGIENLMLTVNAEQIVLLDKNLIPLPGNAAYANVSDFQDLNFNDTVNPLNRIINKRKLDTCYYGLKKNESGYSECSLYDSENGLKIRMFQDSGVTLVFSGDSLLQRRRQSVALEPMQFITNAFNRPECQKDLAILPGDKLDFNFGASTELL